MLQSRLIARRLVNPRSIRRFSSAPKPAIEFEEQHNEPAAASTATANSWLHEDVADFSPPTTPTTSDESFDAEAKKQNTIRDMLQLRERRSDESGGNIPDGSFWFHVGRLSHGSREERAWLLANQPLLDPVLAQLSTRLGELDGKELAKVARGLARSVPPPTSQTRRWSNLWRRIAELATAKHGDFSNVSLLSMLDACSSVGRIGPGVFSALAQEGASRVAAAAEQQPEAKHDDHKDADQTGSKSLASPQAVHMLLRSTSRVNFRSPPLLVACASALHKRVDEVPAPMLIDICYAYATANHRPLSLFGQQGRLGPVLVEQLNAFVEAKEASEEAAAMEEDDDDDEGKPKNIQGSRLARVHQYRLWLDYERRSDEASSGLAQHPKLMEHCMNDFIDLQKRRAGRQQGHAPRDCRRALLELGYTPEERVSPFGYYHQTVINLDGMDVAVEVDLPEGLIGRSRVSSNTNPQYAGWLALRQRQVRFLSMQKGGAAGEPRLLSVPLWDMRPPRDNTEDERAEKRRQALEKLIEQMRAGKSVTRSKK